MADNVLNGLLDTTKQKSLSNQDFKKITDEIIKERGLKIKEFEANAIREARFKLYNEVTVDLMKNHYINDNSRQNLTINNN